VNPSIIKAVKLQEVSSSPEEYDTHFRSFMLILFKFTAEGEHKYDVHPRQIPLTKQDVILRNVGESFNDNNEREVRRLLTLALRAANGEIRRHIACDKRN